MKYISIDIETTGLDPETCQIIEFAAIVNNDTDEYPTFHRYIKHPLYYGKPYALSMHPRIFKELAKGKGIWPGQLAFEFSMFLKENGFDDRITVAGKNFAAFDVKFLEELRDWKKLIKIRHRVLDPAILYMRPEDKVPPNMSTCLERAGLGEVSHTAVGDAMDVIHLIETGIR